MTLQPLLTKIALDEESTRQFKADARNADSFASEIVAIVSTSGTVLSGHIDPMSDLLNMGLAV